MKILLISVFATIAAIQIIKSETEVSSDSSPAVLLNSIPDGTQEIQSPVRQEFQVSPSNILESRSYKQSGCNITIQEIKPIPLPNLSEEKLSGKASVISPEAVSWMSKKYAKRNAVNMLRLSAKVYKISNLPAYSFVTYWPNKADSSISFWSSADFSLIAGGIQQFSDSSGQIHQLFLIHEEINDCRERIIATRREMPNNPPEIPEFPDGEAIYKPIGVSVDANSLLPIQALHDLYNEKLTELSRASQSREEAHIKKLEELQLHPQEDKSITLNFWRDERPSNSEEKAGAK